jgi:hypothetical protein
MSWFHLMQLLADTGSPKDSYGRKNHEDLRIHDQPCGLRLDLLFPARFAVKDGATLDNERSASQGSYLNISLHKISHNAQHQI